MRKLKLFSLAVFASALFFAVGCKKTTTNTTVVKDSVYYSPWIKLVMTENDSPGDTNYTQNLTASKLTQSALSSSAILCYLGSPQNGDTAIIAAADYGLYPSYDVGMIQLIGYGYYYGDFSFATSGYLFRYVIIPGNVISSTSLKNLSKEQLNKMSYTDVNKVLSTVSNGASANQITPTN